MTLVRARRNLLRWMGVGVAAPAAAAVASTWAVPSARAATFPQRPVRIVVPCSVGVGPDVVARSVAERLAHQWSQPVLVDNVPFKEAGAMLAAVAAPAAGTTTAVAILTARLRPRDRPRIASFSARRPGVPADWASARPPSRAGCGRCDGRVRSGP